MPPTATFFTCITALGVAVIALSTLLGYACNKIISLRAELAALKRTNIDPDATMKYYATADKNARPGSIKLTNIEVPR